MTSEFTEFQRRALSKDMIARGFENLHNYHLMKLHKDSKRTVIKKLQPSERIRMRDGQWDI